MRHCECRGDKCRRRDCRLILLRRHSSCRTAAPLARLWQPSYDGTRHGPCGALTLAAVVGLVGLVLVVLTSAALALVAGG